jgi:hypothetical protein
MVLMAKSKFRLPNLAQDVPAQISAIFHQEFPQLPAQLEKAAAGCNLPTLSAP